MPLSDNQKERLRQILLRDYQHESHRIDRLQSGSFGQTRTDTLGELSAYDQHPADTASEYYERERDQAAALEGKRQLRDIERALTELAHKDYGSCVVCGKEIDFSRLLLVPTAVMCRGCAARYGHKRNM